MRLSLPVVASLAALVLAAGCGGADTEPVAFAVADAVPASAAAYVSVQADLESDQWQKVDSLLERFPQGEGGAERALSRVLGRGDLDYERDVRPALGPTLELVWLAPDEGVTELVALTQPEDDDKLQALAGKADQPLIVGDVDDWKALARSEAILERFRDALTRGALADDAGFRSLSAKLPDEALALVYADGEQLQDLAKGLAGSAGATADAVPLDGLSAGVAALEAADEGFRLTVHARMAAPPPQPEASELFGEIPSGAFLAVDFGARGGGATPGLGSLESRAGVPLSQLAAVLEGDTVLYVRPAPIIPELTVLAAPADPEVAKAELDEAIASTPVLGGAERRQTSIDGTLATVVDLGRLSIVYAVVGERLVVSTLPGAIRSLRDGGDKLVDDDRYRDALDAAGVEEGETVLAYADLQQALRLAEGLSMLGDGGVSPDTSRGLEPLRSLVVATATDGDEATFRLFLGVE